MSIAKLRAAIVGFIALLVLVGLPVPGASAHAEVLGSSPASGSTVGGDVERIDIVFGDLVANAVVTVTGPEGPLPGEMVQNEGLVVAFALDDKLSKDGQYKVEFQFDSINDGDFVELEFAFTYQDGAPAPLPVVAGANEQVSSGSTIAIGLLAASTAALGVLLLWRYRKLTAMRAQADSPPS